MIRNLVTEPGSVRLGHYDAAIPPVLSIKSGDVVDLETYSGEPSLLKFLGIKTGRIPRMLEMMYANTRERGPGPHVLTGPIYVEGAEPGDVLEVLIKGIRPIAPFGFNLIKPGLGTLPKEFRRSRKLLVNLDLKKGKVRFRTAVVPLRPFFGNIGVAPPRLMGRVSSVPPGRHGGNLDVKCLTSGARLFLPVHARGALFSVGDGHACQGDGEVDLTACETFLRGRFEFHVRKDMKLEWPMIETKDYVITMGFHQDLDEAAKIAVRNMIGRIMQDYNLRREDAYAVCSFAVDLHVSQLVNQVKGIHAMLPKDVFGHHGIVRRNRARGR